MTKPDLKVSSVQSGWDREFDRWEILAADTERGTRRELQGRKRATRRQRAHRRERQQDQAHAEPLWVRFLYLRVRQNCEKNTKMLQKLRLLFFSILVCVCVREGTEEKRVYEKSGTRRRERRVGESK